MNILKYNEYEGTAELDMDRNVCRGKILFINDVVTYEASSPAQLQAEFEAAVDDYLDTCALLGREPQKPLKGLFNVRIPPSLHKAAALRAQEDEISLNEVVIRSLGTYLNIPSVVKHTHDVKVTLSMSTDEPMKTLMSSTSARPQWETTRVH